ncbi:hypothetical protein PR048_012628 [Dryococelus australis]|uniref:Uncharacterized protein n=1 Tax=Dryococelus australis TaxID=614101 RepID=A0ABQ9HQA9_9NEOP|nr:hypothetical protein PR048_012628 [Dryococelus australis]
MSSTDHDLIHLTNIGIVVIDIVSRRVVVSCIGCAGIFYILTGAAVAERLARSPPTKANRFQSPAGSPDFRMWESCQTMLLVGSFLEDLPFPPPLHYDTQPFASITLIGTQDLALLYYGGDRAAAETKSTLRNNKAPTILWGTSATLSKCENPGGRGWEIELGSLWWETSGAAEECNGQGNPPANGNIRHMFPICETQPGIEPGSLRWKKSSLIAMPPWLHLAYRFGSLSLCALALLYALRQHITKGLREVILMSATARAKAGHNVLLAKFGGRSVLLRILRARWPNVVSLPYKTLNDISGQRPPRIQYTHCHCFRSVDKAQCLYSRVEGGFARRSCGWPPG